MLITYRLLFFVSFCILLTSSAFAKTYIVEHVIAGDILQLTNGEIVRLIGIDTPQSKHDTERTGIDIETIIKIKQEAKEYLANYIKSLPNQEVHLEFDVQKRDKYHKRGWLQAYVFWDTGTVKDGPFDVIVGTNQYFDYFDDKYMHFINATMVKVGYASPMSYPPNVKYAELFEKLNEEAKKLKRGMWIDTKTSREEKEFYKDGTLKLHMFLHDEVSNEGFWKEYHEDGSLKMETKLLKVKGGCSDDGSIPIEGIAREYHKNGTLKMVGAYKNNCEVGIHKYYTLEGLLEQEAYYEEGRHLWTKRYDEIGEVNSEDHYENSEGTVEMKETKAGMRNKLQVAVSVLEALSADKKVPEDIIKKGVDDLQEVFRNLDN